MTVAAGDRRALGLGALGLALLGAFVALRFELATDISHFLPAGRGDHRVRLARELAAGELNRTLLVLVEAGETERAVRAGRALEAELRADAHVVEALAHLEGGPPEGLEEALWRLYQPRRFAFLATDPERVAARLTQEALAEAAAELKRRLALPLSSLLSRVAPEDPTLVLPSLFERLQGSGSEGLTVVDGRFVTADGTAAVLLLTSRASATDASAQRPLLEGLEAAFARSVAGFTDDGPPLALATSGAARFAVRSEAAIQADIRRVSIGSTLGLAVLLLVLFRSLRLVALVLPVVAAGFLVGVSACLLLFGSVHGLTLAFGAALIGVSIDYAVHFHGHQCLAPHPDGPRATLRSIWRGLALGAATTIAGFVALFASSFPGLRELAVFSSTGILAALWATRLFLPALAVRRGAPASTARFAAGITAALAQRRGALWAPVLVVLALSVLGLPRLRWNDELADLGRLDPALLAEDEAVRARVVRYETGRLVVAEGADEQAALVVNDAVAQALEEARAAGELEGFRSVATLLPSAERQRVVDAAVRSSPGLWTRARAALAAEGFVVEGFHPFRDALGEAPPEPLRYADLAGSPLAPLVRPFRVTLEDGRAGFVSLLHGVSEDDALARRVEAIPGASLVDVGGTLTAAFSEYRARMLALVLVGLLGVLALVALRHRALRPTLVAFVPALLGVAGTVGVLSLLGIELNVLALVALLMVVSMGVDYGVFLAESERGTRALDATHLAVFVAGTSTLLGFGLLAFSDQPPLFSIGSTAGVGVLLCFLLAPTLNALLGAPPRRDS